MATDEAPGTGDGPLRRRDRHRPALAGLRVAMRPPVAAIDTHWSQVGVDDDPEDLHELRVALRRTRTLVAAGERVLRRPVRDDLARELAWFAGATGRARDLDVHVVALQDLRGRFADALAIDAVLDRLRTERRAAHVALVELQGAERAATLRTTLVAWCALPDAWVTGGKDAARPVGEVAATRIAQAHTRLRHSIARAGERGDDEALHRLRRDVKRLRYLLEAFAGLGGRDRQRRALRHLRVLQDVLGEHQDAVVQVRQLAVLEEPGSKSEDDVALTSLHREAKERHHRARTSARAAVRAARTSPLHAVVDELVARAGR